MTELTTEELESGGIWDSFCGLMVRDGIPCTVRVGPGPKTFPKSLAYRVNEGLIGVIIKHELEQVNRNGSVDRKEMRMGS